MCANTISMHTQQLLRRTTGGRRHHIDRLLTDATSICQSAGWTAHEEPAALQLSARPSCSAWRPDAQRRPPSSASRLKAGRTAPNCVHHPAKTSIISTYIRSKCVQNLFAQGSGINANVLTCHGILLGGSILRLVVNLVHPLVVLVRVHQPPRIQLPRPCA